MDNLVNVPGFRFDEVTSTIALDPRSESFLNDPYEAYRFLHENRPTFFWENYGHWCCAGFEDVSRLLRDKRFGRQILHVASRQELGLPQPSAHTADFDRIDGLSMLQLEPPVHTRLRQLVGRAFVSTQIERLKPTIETLAHSLIDKFDQASSVNLLEEFAAPIPVIVIADMLGIPREMTNQLLDWSHRMVAMYQFGRNRHVEHNANAAAREFEVYVAGLVAERRMSRRDDLISLMCDAQEGDDELADDEIISTAILLLNAGHEATVHQTGNAIKAVLESSSEKGLDPYEVYFSSDESALKTIEEAMRFDPPLHMFNRYALEDVTIICSRSGRQIQLTKGDEIGLMLGAANHDPTVFDRPNIFDPNRKQLGHVSFGGGIHFCLGAPLARMEMQTSLRVLFERLRKMRLLQQPTYRDAYHFHGLNELLVSSSSCRPAAGSVAR